MSSPEPLVIYETPTEVRRNLIQFMTMRAGLFNVRYIQSEALKTLPGIEPKHIDNYLMDKKMDPKMFASCYVALYCFLERYREEVGIAKSQKRVILERAYLNKTQPTSASS